MNSLSRNELIKALVKGLKLDDNIFNYQVVDEEVKNIRDHQFMDFYKATMGAESYGNGLKAIIDTAEKFKPVIIDDVEQEAKELIELCEGLNTQIGNDAKRMGEDFKKLVYAAKFPTLDTDKIAVLNSVKPHRDHRVLIINIRHYQTAKDSLEAFKSAIRYVDRSIGAVLNSLPNLSTPPQNGGFGHPQFL